MKNIKSKKNVDFLYEPPKNQTPEDLLRIDTNFICLKEEVKRLNEILNFQNSQIEAINEKILKSQEENLTLKSEISRVRNSKDRNILCGREGACYRCAESEAHIGVPSHSDKLDALSKILYKNKDELALIDKRLQVTETLLGLRLR